MGRLDDLMATALAAIPTTGEIAYEKLIDNLKLAGNADAIPLIAELKKRGQVAAKVEFKDGAIIHTYRRAGN